MRAGIHAFKFLATCSQSQPSALVKRFVGQPFCSILSTTSLSWDAPLGDKTHYHTYRTLPNRALGAPGLFAQSRVYLPCDQQLGQYGVQLLHPGRRPATAISLQQPSPTWQRSAECSVLLRVKRTCGHPAHRFVMGRAFVDAVNVILDCLIVV